MNCPCCGARIETSGGCHACSLQSFWCICGQRFCGRHGWEALERHPCPNVQIIGVTVPLQTSVEGF